MPNLFKAPLNIYRWKDIKSFLVRSQYNELLKLVTNEYFTHQHPINLPRFLDSTRCLTLVRGDDRCNCKVEIGTNAAPPPAPPAPALPVSSSDVQIAKVADEEAKSKRRIAANNLNFEWENSAAINPIFKVEIEENGVLKVLIDAIKAKKDTTEQYDAVVKILKSNPLDENLALLKEPIAAYKKGGRGNDLWLKVESAWNEFNIQKAKITVPAVQEGELTKLADAINAKNDIEQTYNQVVAAVLNTLPKVGSPTINDEIKKFEESVSNAVIAQNDLQNKKIAFDETPRKAQKEVDNAIEELNTAIYKNTFAASSANEIEVKTKEIALKEAKEKLYGILRVHQLPNTENCRDAETDYFCLPHFLYNRKQEVKIDPVNPDFLKFQTPGLTVGAVYWLYNYERMGVFKILGVLLDDYNYKGQYTISGNRIDSKCLANRYSALMDLISTLHRVGISSNLRDRVCTYQRVLGLTIDNNLGIESERNVGLMQTFATLNNYMLQYYADKRLATAIQTGGTSRSSVATQTSIKDTLTLFQQQLEPFQYGRNQINTFLGIATVHATLCLLYMLRKEIGIPDQYEAPDEFVQAAYEILVLKRTAMINEKNRFVLYDNCASYGYQLFTDFELLNVAEFNISSDPGSTFNQFLDDSESKVEGLKNALASLPEGGINQ